MSDTLVRTLDALAVADPDAVALISTAGRVSRRALQRRSSAIGRALGARGVRPGDAVAVAIPRSFDSVAALIGVLRAGGAWVPIDPAQPLEREVWGGLSADPAGIANLWLGARRRNGDGGLTVTVVGGFVTHGETPTVPGHGRCLGRRRCPAPSSSGEAPIATCA